MRGYIYAFSVLCLLCLSLVGCDPVSARIIGKDGRHPAVYLASGIREPVGHLKIHFGTAPNNHEIQCTGSFIGRGWILTAAHCVQHVDFGRATEITFRPGLTSQHGGAQKSSQQAALPSQDVIWHREFVQHVFLPKAYSARAGRLLPDENSALQYDFAVLKVRPIEGRYAGTARAAVANGVGLLQFAPKKANAGSRLTMIAYHDDKRDGTPWQQSCALVPSEGRLISHACDSAKGASGGPMLLMVEAGGRTRAQIAALHLGENTRASRPSVHPNRALQLDRGLKEKIHQVMSEGDHHEFVQWSLKAQPYIALGFENQCDQGLIISANHQPSAATAVRFRIDAGMRLTDVLRLAKPVFYLNAQTNLGEWVVLGPAAQVSGGEMPLDQRQLGSIAFGDFVYSLRC